MIKKIKKVRSNMAAAIILTVVGALIFLAAVVGIAGFIGFGNVLGKVYTESTYHIGDMAANLIRGDQIDDYLAGEEMDDYERTQDFLDSYCRGMGVSLIYVIQVNTTDYGRFTVIFESVDNAVDNSSYVPWELGYQRDTSNEEFARKYKALYEEGSEFETVYRLRGTETYHPHITSMLPVRDADKNVVAILCVQRPIHELMHLLLPYLITIILVTSILSVLSAYGVSTFINNLVVVPVRKVSNEATRFAKENTKGEPLGEVSRYTEIRNLANSIDTMETDMVNYIENLTAATAEKERISAELSLASAIQESSIPQNFPAYPERSEFDIYATMDPAKEVGGDFYNFFLIDDDHLLAVIGDVSGKGIPASLFMMVTNIVLTDRSHMTGTPADILNFVNNHICEHNRMDMFVTIWLGILELSTGKIVAANAGHEDAAICRRDGQFELYKTKHGIPVGAMPGVRYKNFEMQLEKGDKLFIYTDGVPEAMDKDNDMFTLTRMIDALNMYKEQSPRGILDGVKKSVNEFVGDAPQFDDLTMLGLTYLPEHKET